MPLRHVARLAAGAGAALVASALVVVAWPHAGSDGADVAVVTVDPRWDAAPTSDARGAAAALRAAQRASRDRTTSALAGSPTTSRPGPVPPSMTKPPAGLTSKPTGKPTSEPTAARTAKVASKNASQGVSDEPCSISSSIETHLTSNARSVYRAVCAAFGDSVSSFGGFRAGDSGDHGSGRAVDIMVSGEPGWEIARYVQAHARELGVAYVIYQQQIWLVGRPTTQWQAMEDRGSRTQNHFDHVHVSVS